MLIENKYKQIQDTQYFMRSDTDQLPYSHQTGFGHGFLHPFHKFDIDS
jgi:hypothetical protein